MSQPPLTRRQREILDFFQAYSSEQGISPTLEEIAENFGVNKVTIFGHVAEDRDLVHTEVLRDLLERRADALFAGVGLEEVQDLALASGERGLGHGVQRSVEEVPRRPGLAEDAVTSPKDFVIRRLDEEGTGDDDGEEEVGGLSLIHI